jgi:hypothetical protein
MRREDPDHGGGAGGDVPPMPPAGWSHAPADADPFRFGRTARAVSVTSGRAARYRRAFGSFQAVPWYSMYSAMVVASFRPKNRSTR